MSWQKVRATVEDVFGSPAADVVDTEPYRETVRRLRDSLVAIKVLQELHSSPIEGLARQLRTAELIADAAAEDKPGPAARRRRRSLRLPVELELGSRLSTRDAQEKLQQQRRDLVEERQKRIGELLAEHEALRGAVAELATLGSAHFRYVGGRRERGHHGARRHPPDHGGHQRRDSTPRSSASSS